MYFPKEKLSFYCLKQNLQNYMYRTLLLILSFSLFACKTTKLSKTEEERQLLQYVYTKAGSNAENIKKVIRNVPEIQKPGALFLLRYMPKKDITTLTSEFISDQLNWAYMARNEFSWCRALPDSIFYNEVLPYCSLDEDRDNWRPQFYNTFKPLVKDCHNIYQAIDSVNLNIQKLLGVD
jgi:hypothetical protein